VAQHIILTLFVFAETAQSPWQCLRLRNWGTQVRVLVSHSAADSKKSWPKVKKKHKWIISKSVIIVRGLFNSLLGHLGWKYDSPWVCFT